MVPSLPTEVLLLIGANVRGRKTFKNLCLTNRRFHEIFAPFLFSDVCLDTKLLQGDASEPPALRCVRKFACTVREGMADGLAGYNEGVTRVLGKMPQLREFIWASDIPPFSDTLAALQANCTQLRSLVLYSPHKYFGWAPWTEYHDPDAEPSIPLPIRKAREKYQFLANFSCKNLVSLRLETIHGDLSRAAASIVSILVGSPGLKNLNLGITETASNDNDFRGVTDYYDFFMSICTLYKDSGQPPLRLRTLFLGIGVMLFANDELQCLDYLTSLSLLESVHIHNRTDRWGPHNWWYDDPMAYSTFSSAHTCPLLRRFSVEKPNKQYMEFLNLIAADPNLPEHFMSEIGFGFDYGLKFVMNLEINEEKRKSWPKTVFWRSNSKTEDIDVDLRWGAMAKWTGLERLAVFVDFQYKKEWDAFILMVHKLPKLRQVSVRCIMGHKINLGVPEDFLPEGYDSEDEDPRKSINVKEYSRAYAEHVLDSTETVMEVQIGEFCWYRSETGAQEMEWEEAREVELFSLLPYARRRFD